MALGFAEIPFFSLAAVIADQIIKANPKILTDEFERNKFLLGIAENTDSTFDHGKAAVERAMAEEEKRKRASPVGGTTGSFFDNIRSLGQ